MRRLASLSPACACDELDVAEVPPGKASCRDLSTLLSFTKNKLDVDLAVKGLSSVTDRLRWSDAWLILRYALLSLLYTFGGGMGGKA